MYDRYGDPEVLRICEVAKPGVKEDQVLVKVECSSVSAADLHMRAASPPIVRILYGLGRPRRTNVLGFEIAGRIVERGASVDDFKVGDRVFAYCSDLFGGYGEYIALDANGPIDEIPATWDFAEAAVTPVAGVTAVRFVTSTKIKTGDQVLVHGASGSVGSFVVQIAHYLGAQVTATCSEEKADFVRSLGAHEVIDYRTTKSSRIDKKFDVVINNVSTYTRAGFMKVLKKNARYASIWQQIRASKSDIKEVRRLAETGAFSPIIDKVFPVGQIRDAHRYVESKAKKGNVAIYMSW